MIQLLCVVVVFLLFLNSAMLHVLGFVFAWILGNVSKNQLGGL